MQQSERKWLTMIVILCTVLGIFGYVWKQRTQIPVVTVTLENLMAPFTYGASRFLEGIHTGIAIIDDGILRVKDMSDIEKRNAELEQKQVAYDELVAENIRLRQLLQFKGEQPQFALLAASVVTRDRGAWTDTFTISRGQADGITPNMAVIAPRGVVGFVSDVYEHSARVQTILDPRSATGVIVQRPESRIASILKGNGNHPMEPQMVNIALNGDVLKGDTIVTSGFGGIYPKGLLLGHVKDIVTDEEGFVKHAVIDPTVDFQSLEEVFVITQSFTARPETPKLEPKLIPRTQRDQVEGAKGTVQQ